MWRTWLAAIFFVVAAKGVSYDEIIRAYCSSVEVTNKFLTMRASVTLCAFDAARACSQPAIPSPGCAEMFASPHAYTFHPCLIFSVTTGSSPFLV